MIESILKNASVVEPLNGIQDKIALAKEEGRPLRVKLGFDPTAPDLHLGHSVVLKKLLDFQNAGHTIVIIVGDFTASLGDPTGRNKLRPPLSADEVEKNAETYLAQLGKIIDIDNAEIHRNSSWLGKLTSQEVIKLMSSVTVAQIMHRDDFKRRFASEAPIHLHELVYPILQGYDSIAIKADVEVGGTDQLFNNLMGRHLQEKHGQPGQAVLTMPLLIGTDGVEKMSKSKGNYIGLTEGANTIFGKIMSIPDHVMPNFFSNVSTFSDEKQRMLLNECSPMTAKKMLARNIIEVLHDSKSADEALAYFERTIQMREPDDEDYTALDIVQYRDTRTVLDLCFAIIKDRSRKDVKRLINQGAVSIDGVVVNDHNMAASLHEGSRITIGKKKHYIIR